MAKRSRPGNVAPGPRGAARTVRAQAQRHGATKNRIGDADPIRPTDAAAPPRSGGGAAFAQRRDGTTRALSCGLPPRYCEAGNTNAPITCGLPIGEVR